MNRATNAQRQYYLVTLIKGLLITVIFGLFARYENIPNGQRVLNGLPFPLAVQDIDIANGTLTSFSIDYVGFPVDVLFWAAFLYTVDFIRSFIHLRFRASKTGDSDRSN